MNLFYQPLIPEGIFHLDPEESKHCIRVLRKNTGDVIRVTDGAGYFYDVVITSADAKQCAFTIQEQIAQPKKSYRIHIAISPTKNPDRLEWFVEKAVELGIDEITFLDCKNTERPYLKTERLQKVALSAMKQSLKASYPVIGELVKFPHFIKNVQANDSKFIAYVDQKNPLHLQAAAQRATSCLVLIGPEGDFSTQELSQSIDAGFAKVSLGESRLRTETAGLAACHILNLINQ